VAPGSASCIAKCLTFGKSLSCIFCSVSIGMLKMSAAWGGLPALLVLLLSSVVQVSLQQSPCTEGVSFC
jgi:hypothetical protein